MAEPLARNILLTLVCVGFVIFPWVAAHRFAREEDHSLVRRWLWPWTIKGLILPLLLWAVMNYGVSFEIQPFLQQVQFAQGGKRWLPVYSKYLIYGFYIISTNWAALTLAWIIYRNRRRPGL